MLAPTVTGGPAVAGKPAVAEAALGGGAWWRWAGGELVGTFLLVFFGCGSVCVAVLTGALVGLWQVAGVWGLGIALAISLTGALSGAHLNPAVTISLSVWRGFPGSRVLPYILSQLLGALAGAALLHLLFGGQLTGFEARHGIVRGQPGSEASAMVFGEFYPNPNGRPLAAAVARSGVELGRAAAAEIVGTALLVLVILGLTDPRNGARPQGLTALGIGLTVTLLICVLAPLTMACFNPARDLGPRLFSALAGWGSVPFRVNGSGWLVVYVGAPILGGLLGGALHRALFGCSCSQTAGRPVVGGGWFRSAGGPSGGGSGRQTAVRS